MRHLLSIALAIMLSGFGVSTPAWSGEFVRAHGNFTVEIDFSTLSLTPIDENCFLVVEGIVRFSGTLEGIASARTRAIASASCDEVSMLPPGAYEDMFTSAFEFAGKVDGRPIVADLTYRGSTAIGGDIDAVLIPSNGLRGRLSVDAIVAAGGSYKGFLKVASQ